jgi:hypothetical protein
MAHVEHRKMDGLRLENLVELAFLLLLALSSERFHALILEVLGLLLFALEVYRMVVEDDFLKSPWSYVRIVVTGALIVIGYRRLHENHVATGSYIMKKLSAINAVVGPTRKGAKA